MSTFEKIAWFLCFLSGIINLTFVGIGALAFERGDGDPEKFHYLLIFLSLGAISWAFAIVIDRLCKRG